MPSDFESRPLQPASSPRPKAKAQRKLPRIPETLHRGGRGLRGRLIAAHAWVRTRGWKRTLKEAAAGVAGLLLLYLFFLWITLPDISDESSLIAVQSSVIVDRNGTELYRLFSEQDRTIIPGEQIPQYMKDAIVAIEDERFYDRGCIDIQAIARAVFRFGQAGGASTLTRQLARNALNLQRENIVNRKLKELILGCSLEHQYTKEELLALYLNWIPFGQNAYGIEQASRRYFGKSAKELTLAESVVLASLPQRPTYFSPYGKHVHTELTEGGLARLAEGKITEAADVRDGDAMIGLLGKTFGSGASAMYIGGRTDQVLRNMQNLGYLEEADRLAALDALKTITFQASRESIRAPHFVLWVKRQLEEMLADGAEEGFLDQGGLTIETTLDWEMQKIAEAAISTKKEDIAAVYGAHNIALVAADPVTKEILAYVGNVDYAEGEHDGKVDMVQVPRQPGSSFKPIVYTTAFEKGYAPATVLYDVPIKIGTDQPQNFEGGFWGLTNVRRALGGSRNIPAIEAYFLAGEEDEVLDMAERLGAPTPKKTQPKAGYGWPLALGAAETPLIEMLQAFSTLADDGKYKPLVSIRKITDRRGNLIALPHENEEPVEVIDPRIAYQMTSVLSDVSARPNEYWQNVLSVPGYQAAAKTGTSNKCLERDEVGNCKKRKPDNLWTMGYTPNIVTGVWVGNADATPLSDRSESLTLAAPIWKEFMTKAHKELEEPKTAFTMPPGLVQPQISTLSGELPTECTPIEFRKADVFLEERSPKKSDPACVTAEIDRVTGLLASEECPMEARETRSFFAPQLLLPGKFPQWATAVQGWAARMGSGSGLSLLPKEECKVTPERLIKPTVTIVYPDGSATYPSFTPKLQFTGAAPREVLYEVDDKRVARATEPPFAPPLRLPRSIDEEGSHTLTVTLTDEYYNIATDETTFRFEEDAAGPRVRLLQPDDGTTVRAGSGITMRAEADDREGGIKYVQFFLDDKLLTTKPREPFQLTYTVTENPGVYRLRVTATDFAGNSAEDEIRIEVVGGGAEEPE